MANILAIVGRPNVGKSTLFNRLTQTRQAIVDSVSGVTRDRHYGKCDWNGLEFSVIDTGLYVYLLDDIFEDEIAKQVHLAIDEASVILLMTDAQSGVTAMDQEVAQILRRSKKHVLLAVNKVDSSIHEPFTADFYSLGLGAPYSVSAINGSGTGEILDTVVEFFRRDEAEQPSEQADPSEKALPRFAIVGRPNVGKSSLTNALLGEERHIVTNIAGTTRDAVDSLYNRFGHRFYLVDTAGLRKKSKVGGRLGVLLGDALGTGHRKRRRMPAGDRRHARLRSPGHEHLPLGRLQPQGHRHPGKQMGPGGQEPQYGTGFRKGDPRKDKPLYRRAHPVHLRFGETAHLQSGRNGRPRV